MKCWSYSACVGLMVWLVYPFSKLLGFLPIDRSASDLIPLLTVADNWFINSMKAFIVNLLKFLTIERTWKEVVFAVGNWLLNLIALSRLFISVVYVFLHVLYEAFLSILLILCMLVVFSLIIILIKYYQPFPL